MLPKLLTLRLNGTLLRRYATRATVGSTTGTSYVSNEFAQQIKLGKAAAGRSIVIEDRTHDHYFWLQDDDRVNDKLLNKYSSGLSRWRAGKLRFLLAEFKNEVEYRQAVRFLRYKHQLCLQDQVCFINDKNFHRSRLELNSVNKQPVKKLIEVHNESNPFDTFYSIVSFQQDSPQKLRIPFEDASAVSDKAEKRRSNQITLAQHQVTMINKLVAGENLLSSLQIKLRFFLINQIEDLIRRQTNAISLKKAAVILPSLMDNFQLISFGSDVSGFGTPDSDLDLCFVPNQSPLKPGGKVRPYRGLKILRTVSQVLQTSSVKVNTTYMSHYHSIIRIFRAFVPIIKCRSRLLPDVNIDISIDMDVNSGVSMAAYLYHCSRYDACVRPFIILLKSWSKYHQIVRSNPGEWFSSFQMTTLGISFLQYRNIVPSIDNWMSLDDEPIVKSQSVSLSEVVQIFGDFLEWMVAYDFWSTGFNLRTGQCRQAKPDISGGGSIIYVQNPFAIRLNVTKTVSEAELERFLNLARKTLEVMGKQDFDLAYIFLDIEDKCFNYHRK